MPMTWLVGLESVQNCAELRTARGHAPSAIEVRGSGFFKSDVMECSIGPCGGPLVAKISELSAPNDKDAAMRLGRLLLAELLRGEVTAPAPEPLTIDRLWRRYSSECAE